MKTSDAILLITVKHLKRLPVAESWRNPQPPPDIVPHNGPGDKFFLSLLNPLLYNVVKAYNV